MLVVVLLALAATKQECARAYERSQELRKDAKLIEAREQLLACASESCPKFVKQDCLGWLDEVNAAVPSVVLSAADGEGAELIDVRAYIDGVLVAEKLDGKAIAVDPGVHRFRFEIRGAEPIERELPIHQGEQNRSIAVALPAPPPRVVETSTASSVVLVDPTPRAPLEREHEASLLPYFLAGGGVVALGGFAAFGLDAKARRNALFLECGASCEDAQVSPIRTRAIVADVALFTGIAALATAAILYFTEEP